MDRQLTESLNTLRAKVDLPPISSSVETYKQALLLVDSAIGFEYAIPLPPRIFHVGPLVSAEKKALVGTNRHVLSEAERWISNHDKIIYFSLGSVALLPNTSLQAIFQTLVGQRVLFSLPRNQHQLARSFVADESAWRLEIWAPQKKLLASPHVKLFISHCGMGGTQESLLANVPLLCIPQVRRPLLNPS